MKNQTVLHILFLDLNLVTTEVIKKPTIFK